MRYIVAGMFERAKLYWTVAMWAKVLVALAAFYLSAQPDSATPVGAIVLLLEISAMIGFSMANALKSAAEPMLSRLDFEHGLGWHLNKSQIDEYRADYGRYELRGRAVRMGDPYFATSSPPSPDVLRESMIESAFYTRAIARSAKTVVYLVTGLIATAFVTLLVTGLYRHFAHGANPVGEFVVDGLIFLVTLDLVPLARQYGDLSVAATRSRDALSGAKTESEIVAAVVEYQLARASAPLLPTFAFLKGRWPLAAIWTGDFRE